MADHLFVYMLAHSIPEGATVRRLKGHTLYKMKHRAGRDCLLVGTGPDSSAANHEWLLWRTPLAHLIAHQTTINETTGEKTMTDAPFDKPADPHLMLGETQLGLILNNHVGVSPAAHAITGYLRGTPSARRLVVSELRAAGHITSTHDASGASWDQCVARIAQTGNVGAAVERLVTGYLARHANGNAVIVGRMRCAGLRMPGPDLTKVSTNDLLAEVARRVDAGGS
jgi:hypothetical protein